MACSRILSASATCSDLLALGRLGSVTGSAHAVLCAAAALWSREPSGWSEEPWADALQALQALQDPSLAVALDTPDIQADVLWTSRMSRSGWSCRAYFESAGSGPEAAMGEAAIESSSSVKAAWFAAVLKFAAAQLY